MRVIKTSGVIDVELKMGEHVLHFYDNEEQRLSVLTEFLKDGFRKHNKSVGVVDKDTAYAVQDRLMKDDIDAGYYMIEGQLLFMTHEDFFQKSGVFDSEKLIDLVTDTSDAALRQGWDGVSLANELTWAVVGDSVDSWLRFEAHVNNYISNLPVVMLCQYNQRAIPGQVVTSLMKTHPYVIMSEDIYQNPYYIDPERFIRGYAANEKFYV